MKIREVVRKGPFAGWMHRRGWYGVTLPWRGGAVIIFWVVRYDWIAEHEYSLHVPQIKRLGGRRYLWLFITIWLRLAVKLRSFARAYDEHPMELSPDAP